MVNALKIVEQANLCSGCGLCQALLGSNRVKINMDANGFLRPTVYAPINDDESSLIASVCPGLNVTHFNADKNYDPIWGPIQSIYRAAAIDEEVRKYGSSGGVLSALQIFLLESGKVDFIVGTSVATDNPLDTKINICKTRADVLKGSGSRYAPSAPLKDIINLLDLPGRFAFVGKPCDVAALRRLGQYDSRVSEKIPYLLSFMCAGIPSRQGTHAILKELGVCPDDVTAFRYRGNGWPGHTTATLKDGTSRSMQYEKSWGHILCHYVQWRCKLCPDGTGEFADIACADAWDIKSDGSPDFSEKEGVSFSIIRSEIGYRLFEDCIKFNSLTIIGKSSVLELQNVQLHQSHRRKTLISRHLAMFILLKKYPAFNTKYLLMASKQIGVWSLLRAFLGAIRRGIK